MARPFNLLTYMQGPIPQWPTNANVEQAHMWRLLDKPENIYVAASINAQLEAARFSLDLQSAGFKVVSSWIRKNHAELAKKAKESDAERISIQKQFGRSDLLDLSNADTLIILTDVPSTSGGLHVELGYFIGSGRTNIICVGPRVNVFFWTEYVRFTPATEGLVDWLQSPDHGQRTKKSGESFAMVKSNEPL